MKKKQQKLVRLIAIVLVVLLVGGAVLSAIISAFAEPAMPERNSYSINITYSETEQALQVSQRLVYHNNSNTHLDRVLFFCDANMFRRESALMYENDVLNTTFPDGYAPGGILINEITVDGQPCDYGFQGENEMILRVGCDLAPAESAEFTFVYTLLITPNRAFLGYSENDVRLEAFYFIPAVYDDSVGSFLAHSPLSFTRYRISEPSDFNITVNAPEGYEYAMSATENARECAVILGKRFRRIDSVLADGMPFSLLTNLRGIGSSVTKDVESALEFYTDSIGAFPYKTLSVVQSDIACEYKSYPGLILLSSDCMQDSSRRRIAIRRALAEQYFGLCATGEPVADAWLTDSLVPYLALLATESIDGESTFAKALNDQVLYSLKITIPGGLNITSPANVFTASEYETIVVNRGTAVFHELRLAMGSDALLDAFRHFYEKGANGALLGEYDLVAALNEATDGDWESFLTDWLFHIGDYVDASLDYYE